MNLTSCSLTLWECCFERFTQHDVSLDRKINLFTKNSIDRRFEAKTKLRNFLTSRDALQCIATCTLKINQNKELLSKHPSEKLFLSYISLQWFWFTPRKFFKKLRYLCVLPLNFKLNSTQPKKIYENFKKVWVGSSKRLLASHLWTSISDCMA